MIIQIFNSIEDKKIEWGDDDLICILSLKLISCLQMA